MINSLYNLWNTLSEGLGSFFNFVLQPIENIVPDWLSVIFNIFTAGLYEAIKGYSLIIIMLGSSLIIYLAITLVQWILKAVPLA